ncbi:MAG TPA: hypothetical protein PLA85_00370 [Micropepsaceae bacterium]|nr:hypothetical protein [Micropepsaceae bacterium]
MTNKKSSPGPYNNYLDALQLIAAQANCGLAKLMPHMGERGRIAEGIIRGVLTRILPKRFAIGTGVVVSASGEMSRQTDIVIFDNFYNAPLLLDSGVGIFPIETVFATMEVKSRLNKRTLENSLRAIKVIRKLSRQKLYVDKDYKQGAGGEIATQVHKRASSLAPRSYIVSFDQRGLGRSYEDFSEALKTCFKEPDDHVHGVAVLSKGWFAGRKAGKDPAEMFGSKTNALLHLFSAILKGQQTFPMFPFDHNRYLKQDY